MTILRRSRLLFVAASPERFVTTVSERDCIFREGRKLQS